MSTSSNTVGFSRFPGVGAVNVPGLLNSALGSPNQSFLLRKVGSHVDMVPAGPPAMMPPASAPPGQSPPTTTTNPTTTGTDTSSIITALLGAYASAFGSSGSTAPAAPLTTPDTTPVVVAPAPASGVSGGEVVLIVLAIAGLAFGIYKWAKRKKGGESAT